jgi:uncharacterized protein YggE
MPQHHPPNNQEAFMKHISTTINVILATVLVLGLVSLWQPQTRTQAAPPATQDTPTCDPSRTVQVTGSASINVIPDRVLIQLGVQSNGATTSAVQSANATAIQSVIRALQSQGIPAKDIATDWYIIEPVYDDYNSLYIKGYRINNMVAVTVRDASKTSKVIAAALEAGANQVVNVEFYTSELRTYRDQARELAMKAAGEKAQALAQAAGAETGCVVTISENTWSYYNGWWYGRNQNLWTQNTVQNSTPGAGSEVSNGDSEPVSLGMISVKAEVGVNYGLK